MNQKIICVWKQVEYEKEKASKIDIDVKDILTAADTQIA